MTPPQWIVLSIYTEGGTALDLMGKQCGCQFGRIDNVDENLQPNNFRKWAPVRDVRSLQPDSSLRGDWEHGKTIMETSNALFGHSDTVTY